MGSASPEFITTAAGKPQILPNSLPTAGFRLDVFDCHRTTNDTLRRQAITTAIAGIFCNLPAKLARDISFTHDKDMSATVGIRWPRHFNKA